MVAAVAAALTTAGPTVSGACACGAFVADHKLRSQQETALVELTGRRESITLAVQTSSDAEQAAFLMPVPARAEFALADGAVFAELDRVSKPDVRVEEVEMDGDGAGAAAPGKGATVVDHVAVGPYEVAQLAGTDSTAVAEWLDDNDFTLPDALGDAFEPYLDDGWLVVAVKLVPESGSLDAGLPPMRLSFETDTPVYPMRLSATAEDEQPLRLYVLADHRVDITNPAPGAREPELVFAGQVQAHPDHPVLSTLLAKPRFLTRYDGEFRPERITDDILITTSDTDEPYRATVVVTKYVRPFSETLLPLLAGGILLVIAATSIVIWLRRRGKRNSLPEPSPDR